jgi:hypothetical protein
MPIMKTDVNYNSHLKLALGEQIFLLSLQGQKEEK